MSNLFKSMESIKSKLDDIEATFTTTPIPVISIDNSQLIQASLKHFKAHFKSKITINVGGVNYAFSQETINNCKLQNIFNNGKTTIFYDGSPYLFEYIAQIFRFFSSKEPNSDSTLKITIKLDEDEGILKKMITEVFLYPEEEVYKYVKIQREVIKEKVVVAPIETLPQPEANNNYNYNYNNRNAAYNYNY
jgi:hypothetical protein